MIRNKQITNSNENDARVVVGFPLSKVAQQPGAFLREGIATPSICSQHG